MVALGANVNLRSKKSVSGRGILSTPGATPLIAAASTSDVALMRTLIDWCRAEGFNSVNLHASVDGRPLYEQLGFEATNEMRLGL